MESIWRVITALGLIVVLVGCARGHYPGRLVDVDSERGDRLGKNYYHYRSHALHPRHVQRYDYHPPTYHDFFHRAHSGYQVPY